MFDYLTATKWVLSGSGLPEATIREIADAVKSQSRGAVSYALNEQGFNWPWFDECLAQFQEWKRWPSLSAWSWFEGGSRLLTGKKDTLDRLPTKTLKNIAIRHQVSIPKGSKVVDIRALLTRKLSQEQIAPYRTILNKRITEKDEARRMQAKYQLLEVSIRSKAYSLHRHGQIADLVTNMGYKARIEFGESLAKKMANGAVFSINNPDLFPPFYPGDSSDVKGVRPKARASAY